MALSIIVIALIFFIIQYVGHVVVFAFVYLDVVFTWSQLPISNVSYYDPTSKWAHIIDRYSMEWWLMLLDAFDMWIPGILIYGYLMMIKGRYRFKWLMIAVLVASFVVNIFKLAFRLYETADCDGFGQLCRSTDPNYKYRFFVTNNQLWLTLVTYNGLFCFWLIIYFVLTSKLATEAKKESEKMLSDWLTEKGIGQPSIYAFLHDPSFLNEAFGEYNTKRQGFIQQILHQQQLLQVQIMNINKHLGLEHIQFIPPVQQEVIIPSNQQEHLSNFPQMMVNPNPSPPLTILNPNQQVMPPEIKEEPNILPPEYNIPPPKEEVNLNLPFNVSPYQSNVNMNVRRRPQRGRGRGK